MKRSLILLFSVFSTIALCAQQKLSFSVLEFEQDVFDTSAKSAEYGKKDGNGSWYAIIKVTSNNPEDDITACQFNFGNMSSKVEKHDEALWVYVQRNAKKVTISRPGYHTINQYDLQTTIEAGANYKMVLKGAVTKQKLVIKCSPADAVVLIDGIEVEDNPVSLTFGSHKYSVFAKGYISQAGTIEVTEKAPAKLIIELDKKDTPIKESSNIATKESPVSNKSKQSVFIESFVNQLSSMFGVKLGETPFETIKNKYNGEIGKEGNGMTWITTEGVEFKDCKKRGVIDQICIDPKKYKNVLVENSFGEYLSALYGFSYNDWNDLFVANGLDSKPWKPYYSKQSILQYTGGGRYIILMFDGKPSHDDTLYSIIVY